MRLARIVVGLLTTFWLAFAGLSAATGLPKPEEIPLGLYLLVIFIPVLLLEAGPVIIPCCGADGICCRTFSVILSFDGVLRALLYVFFSFPCFMQQFAPTQASVTAGILLDVTALLYSIKILEYKKLKAYVNEAPPHASS